MRINIPQKISQYKQHIKESSSKIAYSQRFSFVKIGSMYKNETYRELYICYNPYDIQIKFDINHFNKDKNIYKLYPAVISVKPKEIFSFMIFSTEKSELEFDKDTLLHNQKNRINKLLNDLNKQNNLIDLDIIKEDYDPNINATIMIDRSEIEKTEKETMIDKINVDKTQYLGEILKSAKKESKVYEDYNPEYEDIKVKLENLSYEKHKYKFDLSFVNINVAKSYQIKGIKIVILDKNLKKIIKINHKIKLKNYTMKKISFDIEEEKLKEFMINDIKIDVEVY